jgi:uncharacterized protein (DUF1800 family)
MEANDQLAGLPDNARRFIRETSRQNYLAMVGARTNAALVAPAPFVERMVHFWANHFAVSADKLTVIGMAGLLEFDAIRPHVLGRFRDMLVAVEQHPAMLLYLDQAQSIGPDSRAGQLAARFARQRRGLNENLAREILELHTLGVGSGYTQQDVQQLARVLTGVGINPGAAPNLKPEWRALYVRHGAFEFNPARHDFGPKTLLGKPLGGRGFGEVEHAVALIVQQPACANLIARQMATYFLGDTPEPHLVQAMASTFQRSDGDIAATLRTLFSSTDFSAPGQSKFKDPMHYVVSAVRLAYDGRTVTNTRPLLNWLNALGEAPFNRLSPDGYPLTADSWQSPGQMSRRFEIARAIGTGNARLFDVEDGAASSATGFPQLSNRLYYEAIEPFLAGNTRAALDKAGSPQEWNTFLLASPDMNYE